MEKLEKNTANKKSDRLKKILVNDFQKFKNTNVSSKSSELDDEVLTSFIKVLETKLLDDTLPKAETVRLMKLISIIDWEREKLPSILRILTERLMQQLDFKKNHNQDLNINKFKKAHAKNMGFFGNFIDYFFVKITW